MNPLMFVIPFIALSSTDSLDQTFESLPQERICVCNWPDVTSYVPDVKFAMFHDGDNIYIRYWVNEQGTKAEITTPGGPVYKDSCLECFISPEAGDGLYYNFEVNCIGMLDYSCRRSRTDTTRANEQQRAFVKTFSSLGNKGFPEKKCDPWTLTVIINKKAFYAQDIDTFRGKEFKMNLYKCGDDLKVPHYVSWQPIKIDRPNFHRPDFFVPVRFE